MDRGRNYRHTPAAGKPKETRGGPPNHRVSVAGATGYRPSVGNNRPGAPTGPERPKISKRYLLHLAISFLLVVVLIVSLAEITIYFVRSHNNKAEQAMLADEHQEALEQEQPELNPQDSGEEWMAAAVDNEAATTAPPVQQAARPASFQAVGGEFFQTVGLTRKAFQSILKQNRDTVGWITIEDIVDLPVVYRDNTYYLTHDFNGKKNSCGALFLDENHPIHTDSQNLLIYGHNMKDGSMFGRLTKYYKDANYLRTHYTMKFETRYDTYTYLIFAVVRVKMDVYSQNFLNFAGHAAFSDADTFEAYIDEAYRQSLYTRFLDVQPTDTLITLATCLDDDRLVLLARRQRTDETESDIRHDLLGLYER